MMMGTPSIHDLRLKAEMERRRRTEIAEAHAATLEQPEIALSEYIREAWHLVEPKRPYIHGWHIDAISEHLTAVSEGQIQRLIINIPPRHMKSLSVCVFWPTWEWTYNPSTRWIFSAYSQVLSTRDSLKCRRVIQSPWYQKRWGSLYRLTGDQNQKTRFENDKTGYRIATSVGGTGTGEGGDRIVVDDPLKATDAHSKALREAPNDWWDHEMSTRGNDPDTAAWVIICQRLHERDLPGHVMEKMEEGGDRYDLLILPAEYEPKTYVTSIGWQDPRTESGELLWSARFSQLTLNALKTTLGARDAAAQLQQRPSPAEGDIFKKRWWCFWKPDATELSPVRIQLDDGEEHEAKVVDWPDEYDEIIQSWDMTFKDRKSSDFVAGQVWGRVGAFYYLLDQVHGRMDMPATLRAVEQLTTNWPKSRAKLVEDKANGPAVVQTLKGKIPGLIEVNPHGGKISRANAVAPFIESGNVFLPHPHLSPWVNDLIEECTQFPNGANDDRVDAMTQALIRFTSSEDRQLEVGTGRVVTTDQLGLT